MVYQWKAGSRQTGDAQIAGEMCAALEAEGRLTAEVLVEVNRPEDAPLHNSFEWQDDVAAEEWRKYQARNIIHSITVVAVPDKEPVRAYFNVCTASPQYESLQTIVQHEDKYAQLLESARRELEAFQRKYNTITELSAVFDAINEFNASVA